jgi:hypothetical protein
MDVGISMQGIEFARRTNQVFGQLLLYHAGMCMPNRRVYTCL